MNRKLPILLAAFAIVAATAFWLYSRSLLDTSDPLPPGLVPSFTNSGQYDAYGQIDPASISFRDDAESNSGTTVPLTELDLVGEGLEPVRLADIQGNRNLLLVFLRGAPLCPFCTAQTSRLVGNYKELTDAGAEVAVVFPGSREDLKRLLANAKLEDQELPFPVLVDTDLASIRRLDIEADRAKPSTFIIDRNGRTQFAYIGASMSDRPSIAALLKALERISPESPLQ